MSNGGVCRTAPATPGLLKIWDLLHGGYVIKGSTMPSFMFTHWSVLYYVGWMFEILMDPLSLKADMQSATKESIGKQAVVC